MIFLRMKKDVDVWNEIIRIIKKNIDDIWEVNNDIKEVVIYEK